MQCRVCKSRARPQGKIIDAVSAKWKDVSWFLLQHVNGATHQKRAMAAQASKIHCSLDPEEEAQAKVSCRGLSFRDPAAGPLADYEHHFNQWISWKMESTDLQHHVYKFRSETQDWELRHAECLEKFVPQPGDPPICSKCMTLTARDGLRRALAKSALKKFGAEYLYSKLFRSEEALQELERKIKEDILYKRHCSMFTKMMKYKDRELQQWIRYSFLSVRKSRRNEALQSFIDLVVTPVLSVNVAAAKNKKADLLQAQQSFERFLNDPRHGDEEKMNVAIAQASLQGQLHNNPLLMGMILSCMKVIDRQSAGHKMHGPSSKNSGLESDIARDLASEAGAVLAAAGNNSHFLSRFGLNKKHIGMDSFDERLTRVSLPVPFLALRERHLIRENMLLIDQKLSAFTNTYGRDLVGLFCELFVPC